MSTPARIADELEHWFRSGAADGFNIMPPVEPASLDDFVALVIPELQRRGLFRTRYEGRTLRENLGLRWPANRFARGGQSDAVTSEQKLKRASGSSRRNIPTSTSRAASRTTVQSPTQYESFCIAPGNLP